MVVKPWNIFNLQTTNAFYRIIWEPSSYKFLEHNDEPVGFNSYTSYNTICILKNFDYFIFKEPVEFEYGFDFSFTYLYFHISYEYT